MVYTMEKGGTLELSSMESVVEAFGVDVLRDLGP